MKLFESVQVEAVDLVRKLIENESAEDAGWEDDIKDVIELGQEDQWFQIGGDVGNSWIYGGTWYNPKLNELIHFAGIENDPEIDPDTVVVPEYTLAKIKSKVHDPYLDTDEGKEDPAWLAKQLRDEEWEVERIVQQYQVSRAEFLETRKLRTFYRGTVPRPDDYLFKNYDPEVSRQFDNPDDYMGWPPQNKLAEIANYAGWHEVGDEVRWNYLEAKAILGYQRSF